MRFRAQCLAGIAFAMYAIPALAHHSFSMFDQTQMMEVQGTVKECLWTNPHSWLQILASDGQGETVEWSIEMSAIGALTRDGWTTSTVSTGDLVTVTAHPLRDGSPGGQFVGIVLPNGEELTHKYRDTPVSTIPPR